MLPIQLYVFDLFAIILSYNYICKVLVDLHNGIIIVRKTIVAPLGGARMLANVTLTKNCCHLISHYNGMG